MFYLWTRPEIKSPNYYHNNFLVELSKIFQTEPLIAGREIENKMREESNTHLFFVPCRWLFDNQQFFRKLKNCKTTVLEHDAYLNFMPESPWYKSYTRFYRTCNFDLLICSGKETTNKIREEGIPAVWVPKGCDKKFTHVQNNFIRRIGYFGKPILEQKVNKPVHFYSSRHEMSDILEQAGLPLIASKVEDFDKVVPMYSAGVQNDASMGEPMAKHFEASAMGCLPIRDHQNELLDLGYVNNESMVFYDSWAEMLEIVDHFKKKRNKPLLRKMQNKAIEVSKNHTWECRARQVFDIVKPYMKERIFV